MKHVLITIAIACLSLYGCKKQDSRSREPQLPATNARYIESSDLGFEFASIGGIHNEGLGYIENHVNFSTNPMGLAYATRVNSLSFKFLKANYAPSLSVSDSLAIDSIVRISIAGDVFSHAEDLWDAGVSASAALVSSTEFSLLSDCNDLFADASRITNRRDQYDYLIDGLDDLIARYNSHSFDNGAGSLAGGALLIARSSAGFWRDYSTSVNPAPAMVVVQADAAGYIYGWTKAWLFDELPTPSQRIKAGLSMAMDVSTGAIFSRYFGI
jgi:hypothetical protein